MFKINKKNVLEVQYVTVLQDSLDDYIYLPDETFFKMAEARNNAFHGKNPYYIDVKKLLEDTAKQFGLTAYSLENDTRRYKHYVVARQCVLYILYKNSYGSLVQIGAVLHKDHATVLHANRQIESLIETRDKEYFPKMLPLLVKYNIWDEETNSFKKHADGELCKSRNENGGWKPYSQK